MPDQKLQIRIECENLSQLRQRLRRVDAAAEIPSPLDRTVEKMILPLGPPIQRSSGQVDNASGQRCNQRIAGGIGEMRRT